jgi:excisionase family DNA binding protein
MSPRLHEGELRARRAAKILGVKLETMYRWCREGRIAARTDPTGHYFVNRCLVDQILSDPRSWREKRRADVE